MSDIDTAVVDSLKALDPERPIREADTHALQHDRRKKKDRWSSTREHAMADFKARWLCGKCPLTSGNRSVHNLT